MLMVDFSNCHYVKKIVLTIVKTKYSIVVYSNKKMFYMKIFKEEDCLEHYLRWNNWGQKLFYREAFKEGNCLKNLLDRII